MTLECQRGQIRHLPGGVYWEQGCTRDQYQNGAYWATPVGWFVYTLDLVDAKLADQTILDMVSDFKRHGACEWIIGEHRQLPHYLASAALPLDGISKMLERRQAPDLQASRPGALQDTQTGQADDLENHFGSGMQRRITVVWAATKCPSCSVERD